MNNGDLRNHNSRYCFKPHGTPFDSDEEPNAPVEEENKSVPSVEIEEDIDDTL